MPCFRPLSGYRSKSVNPTGKRSIVWTPREAHSPDHGRGPEALSIPCGQCIYCRLEHSRGWAVRATHEASLYDRNCFLTLTYSDDHLPRGGSLDYDAAPEFMKRLRKEFGEGIRSFGCAEYGELLSRPHYHICVFNFDFPDKILWKKENENSLYISEKLQALWPYGHSTIGELTFESAAYVARYVTKKITGKRAENHYETIDPLTGEIHQKLPERSVAVSRMPGLGKPWLDKYFQFVLDHDFVVSRGKKIRPPKYYDRLLEVAHPQKFDENKKKRREAGKIAADKMIQEDHDAIQKYWQNHDRLYASHGTGPTHRLTVMEEVKILQAKQLKRGIESG